MAIVQTHATDLERASTQYWSITDASQTGLDIATDFTFEGWGRLESLPTGLNYTIVSKWSSGANRSYIFSYSSTSLRLVIFDGSAASEQTVAFTASIETWYHLAVSYDVSAGEAKFYVNGSQQGATQGSGKTTINTGAADFAVGDDANTGSGWDGELKDIRVWSDIRTEAEINANKDNCNLSVSEAGLVSWWAFNNDGTDENANGNDLTNNNTATFVTELPYTCPIGPANLKTWNTITPSTIKTRNTVAIANVKTANTVT